MIKVLDFKNDFTGINYILYSNIAEKKQFLEYIYHVYKHKVFNTYLIPNSGVKNAKKINNKSKLSYNNTVIITNGQKYKNIANIVKNKDIPVFVLIKTNHNILQHDRLIMSPTKFASDKYHTTFSKNQKNFYSNNFTGWIVIDKNANNPINKYTNLKLDINNIKKNINTNNIDTDYDITNNFDNEDEINTIEYYIDNPIIINSSFPSQNTDIMCF